MKLHSCLSQKREQKGQKALHTALIKIRPLNTHNGGNPNARGMKKEEIAQNTTSFESLLETHGLGSDQQPGKKFWVREKKDAKQPPNGSLSE